MRDARADGADAKRQLQAANERLEREGQRVGQLEAALVEERAEGKRLTNSLSQARGAVASPEDSTLNLVGGISIPEKKGHQRTFPKRRCTIIPRGNCAANAPSSTHMQFPAILSSS